MEFSEENKMKLVNLRLKIKTANEKNQHIEETATIPVTWNKITENLDIYIVVSL